MIKYSEVDLGILPTTTQKDRAILISALLYIKQKDELSIHRLERSLKDLLYPIYSSQDFYNRIIFNLTKTTNKKTSIKLIEYYVGMAIQTSIEDMGYENYLKKSS